MKRNMLKYSLLGGICMMMFMTACKKDFLEVTPVGLIESKDYLKTESEAFTALVGVYDLMQFNYNNPWNSAYFMKTLLGDDMNCAGGSNADQPPYQQLNAYSFESDNPVITSVWTGYYRTIAMCNTIIERAQPTTDGLKLIIAEAKAIRAYNYLELVTLYGDVPLLLVNPKSPSEYSQPRVEKAKVFAQIIKDLTEAIPNMKAKSELDFKFRFSKGAAQATLGKAYLYQKDYTNAAAALQSVIDDQADYDLSTAYGQIWDSDKCLGKESVFAILFSSTEKYNWDNFPWSGRPESNIHVQLEGPRDFFLLGNTGLINGWGFNLPTKKLWDAYVAAGDVVRRKATMLSLAELQAAGGGIKAGIDPATIWGYEGFIRVKYATKLTETNTSDGVVPDLNYRTAWLLIRTADVYLMAAEAYANLPTPDNAKANLYLNKVRERVSLPDVNLSGAALMKQIKTERMLELSIEGSRYNDLVRWGDASTELSARGFKSNKHELLPLPLNEVNANTQIGTKGQNPGY